MRLLFIVNPVAGRNYGREAARRAEALLIAKGATVEIAFSLFAGHAVELARTADLKELDGIVAVGGDGTLFEVVNGLLKTHEDLPVPLGQIPVGTGNSFSQDLEIHDLETAIEKISLGKTKNFDVGFFTCEMGFFYFLNVLGVGFVADVCAWAFQRKGLGQLSYALGVIIITASLDHFQLRLTVDGTVYEREGCFVEVCNSRYTAGNMKIAPEAKIDDGLLDVMLLNRISRLRLLKAFPLVFSGKHLSIPQVEVFRGEHIKVETDQAKILTPDGEVFGHTPIEAGVLRQKIRMFF